MNHPDHDISPDNTLRLGILGGSFDPIHCGHLKIAEDSRSKYGLNRVIFVPAFCPPHKARPVLAPFEHRLEMVKLAILDMPGCEISDIERGGTCPSYAGTTVEKLKTRYGPGCSFYFIIGLDTLLTITNTEKSHTYPGLCYFIATTRPGFNKAAIMQEVPPEFHPYIIINEMPALSISSTDIKHRIRTGRSIDGMVTEAVKNHIYTFNIYTRCFT